MHTIMFTAETENYPQTIKTYNKIIQIYIKLQFKVVLL